MLTKSGKIFSVSSYDGSIFWNFYDYSQKVLKIFVEPSAGSDNRLDVILITGTHKILLDPLTGEVRSKNAHGIDATQHSFMLIKNVVESGSDYVVVAISNKD